MPEKTATELWDALVEAKGEYPPLAYRDATEGVALKGYRSLLEALEGLGHTADANLAYCGKTATQRVFCLGCKALAVERARIQEAHDE